LIPLPAVALPPIAAAPGWVGQPRLRSPRVLRLTAPPWSPPRSN